ncbi:putative aspartate aminotransferase, cytoplasmic [Lachnellula hyalina]|uniref:Putative aspartate aminotransferase, cytoplasmic n=1 Tax=Lachnellula hyalina TaxID=1316788 RepID=A0A8H8R4V6_9HELO|nr:putative aspartate aminotransferase, cytoplasmic [Lachnellula hyalina]TVY28388.1 putative aspartate aminotransferase, cytoplasmic [Lachnellula hyalina]
MQKSVFAEIPIGVEDEPFQLTALYEIDPSPEKVNLSIGAYRDADGKPWVLPVVRKTEMEICSNRAPTHEYLPIRGHSEFLTAAMTLLFRDLEPQLSSRIASMQTLSGTGACHVGARLLADFLKPKSVWISDPTWNNHHIIWKLVGEHIQRKTYPYYNPQTKAIDEDGMLAALEGAEEGDVVILHACAHNPTGLDLDQRQWTELANLISRKRLHPFFDVAYQGFASGDPDKDAWAVRYFVGRGLELCISQAFSKNMGLYGERVGALHVVTSNVISKDLVQGQLAYYQRGEISTPPTHGARIVSVILQDQSLRNEWLRNLKEMTSRIGSMRVSLYEEFQKLGTPGSWNHLLQQTGMFCYTGLSAAHVSALRIRYHVYMLCSGRLAIPGMNEHNIRYVAKSIDTVVRELAA